MDLLAAWELELRAAACLHSGGALRILSTDRHQNLSNVAASSSAVALTPCSTHAGLESVRTCAREHLVDAEDLERVRTDADVEEILTSVGHHVLVRSDTGGLESLTRDLLVLIRHHVHDRWEVVAWNLLLASLVDTNLRV